MAAAPTLARNPRGQCSGAGAVAVCVDVAASMFVLMAFSRSIAEFVRTSLALFRKFLALFRKLLAVVR
jgi:hypothetical protein